jgi:membrane protease YdiL (CAAX protease family)
VTALVGFIAFAATWWLWHTRLPLAPEPGALWTTLLLLGLPLIGIYALTDAEIVAFGWLRPDADRAGKYIFGAVVLSVPFVLTAGFMPGGGHAWPYDTATGGGSYGLIGAALALAWRGFVVEWFFRGFVLFGLLRRIGTQALLVQMAAFGLLYLGAPWPIALAAWPAGFILGFVAWRCGSFLPAATAHIIIVLLMHLVRTVTGPA